MHHVPTSPPFVLTCHRPSVYHDRVRVRETKLLPTADQTRALLGTMRAVNAAKNMIATTMPKATAFTAHKALYAIVRANFGLGAQLAVRAIADACAQRKRHATRSFRDTGSIAYDARIASVKARGISLSTLGGRMTIPVAPGSWCPERIDVECRLVFRDGMFFLCVPVADAHVVVAPVRDFLGVDLGIVNIAVDSDGRVFSGAQVNNVRHRHRRRRAALQKRGTRSAKKRLRKLRRSEQRFARDVNHVVSKHLVAKAKDTGRGIALEDLKGIRERTTVRRPQRAARCSWAFAQLRAFVEYKSVNAGVAVVAVDPRNTSRTCPLCAHVDKANRRTRDAFLCVICGFAGPADHIAAENIRRAAVNRPIVTRDVVEQDHLSVASPTL